MYRPNTQPRPSARWNDKHHQTIAASEDTEPPPTPRNPGHPRTSTRPGAVIPTPRRGLTTRTPTPPSGMSRELKSSETEDAPYSPQRFPSCSLRHTPRRRRKYLPGGKVRQPLWRDRNETVAHSHRPLPTWWPSGTPSPEHRRNVHQTVDHRCLVAHERRERPTAETMTTTGRSTSSIPPGHDRSGPQ
jgi:hypothetical protein